jgi:hypothetical protein
LTVTVHSDPSLFRRGQALRARVRTDDGLTETSTVVPSTGDRVALLTPVTPRNGVCSVELTVAPTAVPSEVLEGSTDDRELGLHFDAFAYEPGS